MSTLFLLRVYPKMTNPRGRDIKEEPRRRLYCRDLTCGVSSISEYNCLCMLIRLSSREESDVYSDKGDSYKHAYRFVKFRDILTL